MADNVTMDQLILEVRRLGGFESLDPANSFVTDDEIESRANANLRKVYLALVRARGANYFRKSKDFSTVVGKSTYDIVADVVVTDFFELISMSRQVNSTWAPLVDFGESERHDFDEWPVALSGDPVRFQLRAGTIELQPTPAVVETMRLYYVPSFVPLLRTSESDGPPVPFDGVEGFYEWAIWETVAELQAKDMADPSLALGKARWWEGEVESMARQRNASMPQRVNRVRSRRRFNNWSR